MRYAVLITLLVLIAAIVYWRRTDEMRYRVRMADRGIVAMMFRTLSKVLEGVPQTEVAGRLKRALAENELGGEFDDITLTPRAGATPIYVVELLESRTHPEGEPQVFILRLLSRYGKPDDPKCAGSFTAPPSGIRFLPEPEINVLNDPKNYESLGTIYFYRRQ